jgi:IclR family acetate operon transcriptional repressor
MRALWESYGETVNLGIQVGGRVLYQDLIESPQRLRTTSRVGSSDPLHSTALGKAILAFLPTSEASRLLISTVWERRTPMTRVGVEALLEDLEVTRRRGYAVDDEENELGSRCVAAGVLDPEGTPVAALSVSAPTVRFDDERLGLIGQAVIRSSRELSAAFAQPPVPHDAPGRFHARAGRSERA